MSKKFTTLGQANSELAEKQARRVELHNQSRIIDARLRAEMSRIDVHYGIAEVPDYEYAKGDALAAQLEPIQEEIEAIDLWMATPYDGDTTNDLTADAVYDIEIAEFNSSGIRAEAKKAGITHMRKIGGGFVEGHENEADWYVGFYAIPHPKYGDFRVANTNGDPVWEENDAQAFADLAEQCGVEI